MSVVAVKRPAAITSRSVSVGTSGMYDSRRASSGHAIRVVVDPGYSKAAPGELHGQGKTDVSLAHHRYRGGPALDAFLEAHRSTGLATLSLGV